MTERCSQTATRPLSRLLRVYTMRKSVVQRMASAKMRTIAPAAPSDMSSGPQPKKNLRMRAPSSASRSACVSAVAILVMTFLSMDMISLVKGFVITLRMSGGFSAEERPGDASMIALETW